ncbi:DUF4338 domain-containing protein [bacterium]|nr:DUF4338 domain-containing protein [bacterium]
MGWSTAQVKERRKHIANNSRFCVLPKYAGVPNLASKVLSMVSARISSDWEEQYGIPLLALETYVDPEYNENDGACYKAAGWEKLGYSTGHRHANGERTHSKWYFLKPLHEESYTALSSVLPHALMTGAKKVSKGSDNNYVLDVSRIDLPSLQRDLKSITDPRGKQGRRYKFVPFLSLCICAVVSGYTEYRQIADWISRLPAEDRVRFGMCGDMSPSESAVSKFLRRIDPVELNSVVTKWLLETYDKNSKIKTLSLDGKAQRASSSDAKEQKAFLNVFAHELGIVVNHSSTKKGGGEKATARTLVDAGELFRGKTVLADTIHTDEKLLGSLKKKVLRTSSLSKIIREG